MLFSNWVVILVVLGCHNALGSDEADLSSDETRIFQQWIAPPMERRGGARLNVRNAEHNQGNQGLSPSNDNPNGERILRVSPKKKMPDMAQPVNQTTFRGAYFHGGHIPGPGYGGRPGGYGGGGVGYGGAGGYGGGGGGGYGGGHPGYGGPGGYGGGYGAGIGYGGGVGYGGPVAVPVAYGGPGGGYGGAYGGGAAYGGQGYGVAVAQAELILVVEFLPTQCEASLHLLALKNNYTAFLVFDRPKLCARALKKLSSVGPQTIVSRGLVELAPATDQLQILVTSVEYRGSNVVLFILALSTEGRLEGRFIAIRTSFSVGQLFRFCTEVTEARITSDDANLVVGDIPGSTVATCHDNPSTCLERVRAKKLIECEGRATAA